MDDRLMVLMNMFLNNDWLVMLMHNFLMMFMHDVLLVLNQYILVMLMDNILMNFLDNGLSNVGSHICSKFVSFDCLSFICLLKDRLLLMSNNNGLLVDLLYDNLTLRKCSWSNKSWSNSRGSCSCSISKNLLRWRSTSYEVSFLEICSSCSTNSRVEISRITSVEARSSKSYIRKVLVLRSLSGDDIFLVVYVLWHCLGVSFCFGLVKFIINYSFEIPYVVLLMAIEY